MISNMKRSDGKEVTPGGWPLPFTGKPMVTERVVRKSADADLHQYPETFRPGEELGADEIRVTCTGSGNPAIRRGQACAGWLVEVGNGENFIFDVGGGSVSNLLSLEVHPAVLDKVFITHAHIDHIGGMLVLLDTMGWGRNTPLHVWGPSHDPANMGIASICESFQNVISWHNESMKGSLPSGGETIVSHEFDCDALSADNPTSLVYDDSGVKIFAFPVMHCMRGAVGYRLEWNGLSVSLHGDGEPTVLEAQQVKAVDVMIHEAFIPFELVAERLNITPQVAKNILHSHTSPSDLGKLLDISKPNLGVGYHYALNDDSIDPFFDGATSTYDGPVALAQDLMVINITPEQIVTRMGDTDPLHWARPSPKEAPPLSFEEKSSYVTPRFITDTRLPYE